MEYKTGDVVCMTCKKVIRHDPRIKGVSHGYCKKCGEKALKEVEEWIKSKTGLSEEKNRSS